MKKLAEINNVETFAKIEERGKLQHMMMLARKTLPEIGCLQRNGNEFSFYVLMLISKIILSGLDVFGLDKVCPSCVYKIDCKKAKTPYN